MKLSLSLKQMVSQAISIFYTHVDIRDKKLMCVYFNVTSNLLLLEITAQKDPTPTHLAVFNKTEDLGFSSVYAFFSA